MKYKAEDVRAVASAAVRMVKAYVDGTGVFPSGDNLSGMVEAAMRAQTRKPKWGIDNLKLLFEEAKAKATDVTEFNKANHFTAEEVLKAQVILLKSLLHAQGFSPMDPLLPFILSAVTGDQFDRFCELLRQV